MQSAGAGVEQPQQQLPLNVFFGIWINLPSSKVWSCLHPSPICLSTAYESAQTNMDVEKKLAEFYYGLNHVIMSLFHSAR